MGSTTTEDSLRMNEYPRNVLRSKRNVLGNMKRKDQTKERPDIVDKWCQSWIQLI